MRSASNILVGNTSHLRTSNEQSVQESKSDYQAPYWSTETLLKTNKSTNEDEPEQVENLMMTEPSARKMSLANNFQGNRQL